jgi:hypothetical protein
MIEDRDCRLHTGQAGKYEEGPVPQAAGRRRRPGSRAYERLFSVLSHLPKRRIPINDLLAVCQGDSHFVLICRNNVS